MNFWLKYAAIMFCFMIVIAILGHFIAEIINHSNPPPKDMVYSSREAAYAAAYKGEGIMNKIELAAIFIGSIVTFKFLKKGHNNKDNNPYGKD